MMQIKLIMALVTIVFFAMTLWSGPVVTQSSSNIVVGGADSAWLMLMTQSAELGAVAQSVSPRAISVYADTTFKQPLVGVSDTLQIVLSTVRRQVISEYADSGLRYDLAGVPGALGEHLNAVTARIIAGYNDGGYVARLSYPKVLLNDTVAPVINNFTNGVATGSANVRWNTDEFTRCTVHYGTQPGIYTGTVELLLYAKQHEATLVGAVAGATYYVQITCTDQSDNVINSAEFNFMLVITRSLFLPLIRR